MQNYTKLKTDKNKNIFFIIANIFLMIIIVGITGFYLKNRFINKEKKAVAPGACMCANNSNGQNAGEGVCNENGDCICRSGTHVKNNRCGETSGRGNPEEQNNQKSCENSGGHWCDVWDIKQQKHSFCAGKNETCNNAAVARGITLRTGGDGPGEGGWRCIIGRNGYTGGPCVEYNSVETLGCNLPKCFCGVIQIDGCGNLAGTYESTCSCENEEINQSVISPTPTRIITPTNTPTMTPTRIITPTNTPTMTPTGTLAPTNTPTMTPTGTLAPTNTPTMTPTGTLAPTNTPTVIVNLLQSGLITPFIFAIPIGIIILGLLL